MNQASGSLSFDSHDHGISWYFQKKMISCQKFHRKIRRTEKSTDEEKSETQFSRFSPSYAAINSPDSNQMANGLAKKQPMAGSFAVIVQAFELLLTGSHLKEIFVVLSGWLHPIGSEIRIGFL